MHFKIAKCMVIYPRIEKAGYPHNMGDYFGKQRFRGGDKGYLR